MLIDPRRYKRPELAPAQMEFLTKLVSFGRLIQATTYQKCQTVRIPSELGICSSLVMAHIIDTSNWGTHIIAQKENNLCLLTKSEYWKGKSVGLTNISDTKVTVAGVLYRSYPSWLDFSINLTDELTFFERPKYFEVLKAGNLDLQAELFSTLMPDSTNYYGRIDSLIEKYGLWEFDY